VVLPGASQAAYRHRGDLKQSFIATYCMIGEGGSQPTYEDLETSLTADSFEILSYVGFASLSRLRILTEPLVMFFRRPADGSQPTYEGLLMLL